MTSEWRHEGPLNDVLRTTGGRLDDVLMTSWERPHIEICLSDYITMWLQRKLKAWRCDKHFDNVCKMFCTRLQNLWKFPQFIFVTFGIKMNGLFLEPPKFHNSSPPKAKTKSHIRNVIPQKKLFELQCTCTNTKIKKILKNWAPNNTFNNSHHKKALFRATHIIVLTCWNS